MSGFMICKENNDFYVAISEFNALYSYPNKEPNESNYPVKVINNKYGKIIIGVSQFARLAQLIFSNTKSLFNFNKHIDYTYLKETFFPKCAKLFSEESNINCVSDTNGKDGIFTSMFVIAEDKAYIITENGFVKEQDMISDTWGQEAILYSLYEQYEVHDEKFLNRALLLSSLENQSFLPGIINISTKDYKPSYKSIFKEDI